MTFTVKVPVNGLYLRSLPPPIETRYMVTADRDAAPGTSSPCRAYSTNVGSDSPASNGLSQNNSPVRIS